MAVIKAITVVTIVEVTAVLAMVAWLETSAGVEGILRVEDTVELEVGALDIVEMAAMVVEELLFPVWEVNLSF